MCFFVFLIAPDQNLAWRLLDEGDVLGDTADCCPELEKGQCCEWMGWETRSKGQSYCTQDPTMLQARRREL